MKRCMVWVVGGLAGCVDLAGAGGGTDEQELITTVELGFSGVGAEVPVDARWSDPDLDGTPEIAPAVLALGGRYVLSVRFLDEASEPVEDLTLEVLAESDAHQVFLTGQGVQGPATASLSEPLLDLADADVDALGLPVGLRHDVSALAPGAGTLQVTLQHLPAQDGVAVKVAGLAERVASEGLGALPGETDVSVGIPFEVR